MNQKWSSTSGSTLLPHVLAPLLQTHQESTRLAHNHQKWLRVSRLGFWAVEAGDEANTLGLRCLNRVQNPRTRVSFLPAYSLSWGLATRRVGFQNPQSNSSLLDDFEASNSSSFYIKVSNYKLNTYREPGVSDLLKYLITTCFYSYLKVKYDEN